MVLLLFFVESMQNWRPVFDKYDHDHDGLINMKEFRSILEASNNDLGEDIPKHVLEALLDPREFPDDVLTFEGFMQLV